MSTTMTHEDLAARLDSIDDDAIVSLLMELEDGDAAAIPDRAVKIAATGAAIRRRPFAAYLLVHAGETVTARDAAWALALQAVFASPARTDLDRETAILIDLRRRLDRCASNLNSIDAVPDDVRDHMADALDHLLLAVDALHDRGPDD